jgi:hypothetical protein
MLSVADYRQGQRRLGVSRLRLLSALVIALDVIAIALGISRGSHPERDRHLPAGSGAFVPTEFSIGIVRPDMSAIATMPCFQQPGTGGIGYAALAGPTPAECRVATEEPLRSDPPPRSLGSW